MSETAPDGSPDTSAPSGGVDRVPPHRHRILIGRLFALATIIGIVAVLAVWANRQALNTDNWTSTSTQLLADKRIQTAVAAYSVDQLFKSGAVESEVQAALPPRLQALAGPI